MKERLDQVDLRILRFLQQDGRMTNADLARRIGLSPPSVLQRVRKLEESGLITGYAATLNPEKLGFGLTVYTQISMALHQEQPIETFRHEVLALEEVIECHHVSGDYDFLLKIVVPGIREYERLLRERLIKIPGIGRITSCFVLATTKQATGIPIPDSVEER